MAELDTNTTETVDTENQETTPDETNEQNPQESAEVAKLKAELARTKAAMDKAAKEAGDAKKALRAKQTAEEAAAEAEKEQKEAILKELEDLRKERAVANSSKRIMAFVQDENAATGIAEAMYGAADVDLAVDGFAKAWAAKEKALKLEYGKIPAPGVGGTDGPTVTAEQLKGMGYKQRVEFAKNHPEEYNKLMGR